MEIGTLMGNTYSHLEDEEAILWIAVYTGMGAYIDDTFRDHVAPLCDFTVKLTAGEQPSDPVMAAFAVCLSDVKKYFSPLSSGLILTSIANSMSAMVIEAEAREKSSLGPDASNYPEFMRNLSGIQVAFSLYIWPPSISISRYMQALQDIGDLLSFLNDAFSFYKEELKGETDNFITMKAQVRGSTKIEALRDLAQECNNRQQRVRRVLMEDKEVYDIWMAFIIRYVHFHFAANKRYHLSELGIVQE
ncbi:hypothetical protein AX16_005474 [Volvariella volvacea WC 439]|nr:hypothetical protein AX16_005474 [Volvariella volvacea WC 439]